MATKDRRILAKQQAEVSLVGPERTKQRHEEFVPDIQLTLISVIQGAALAFLATNIKESLEDGRMIHDVFPTLITLLVICSFWYSALVGVTYLRWRLSLLDTILYFTLGLTENVMVQFISDAWWWVSLMGTFAVLTAATYWHNARQLNRADYEDRGLYHQHVAERKKRAFAAAICGALHILAIYATPQNLTWVYIFDLLFACFVMYSVRRSVSRDVPV
jgi:hypothetical protein